VLKGKIGGKEKKLGYGEKLPDEEKDNDFVEHIWATRKVGYLLDQIRLNGESQELKDEVIALARAYGIVTPYTSFLVVEDTVGPLPEPGPGPWPAPQPAPFPPGPFYSPPVFYGPEESASGGSASPGYAPGLKKAKEQASAMDSIAGSAGSLKSEKAMGQEGAVMSKVLDEMKNTETQGAGPSKMVGGKLFVYTGGRWVDGAYKKEMKLLKIEFGSDAYFALVELRPDLVKALALGTRVIVVVGEKKAISIESGSDEKPSKKDVEKFLK